MYILDFQFSEFFSEPMYVAVIVGAIFTIWRSFRKKNRIPKCSLLEAASNRDLEKFKTELAKKKVDVNQINLNRHTPLISATLNFGTKYLIEELIAKGAFVNWQDINGNTALHYAVDRKKKALVKIFVENEADLTLKNEDGKTPLDIAKEKGLDVIIQLLEKTTTNATHNNDV